MMFKTLIAAAVAAAFATAVPAMLREWPVSQTRAGPDP